MYNKLFTQILDSSIWLESAYVRLVWITFIAMMDQDGIVALSCIGNVASRARVTDEQAEEAIKCLESVDLRNPDQDHEGKRIERIPGIGWLVINAEKYREIVKADMMRQKTREKVAKHRAKKKLGNPSVTKRDQNVTQSYSYSDSNIRERGDASQVLRTGKPKMEGTFTEEVSDQFDITMTWLKNKKNMRHLPPQEYDALFIELDKHGIGYEEFKTYYEWFEQQDWVQGKTIPVGWLIKSSNIEDYLNRNNKKEKSNGNRKARSGDMSNYLKELDTST